VFFFKFTAVAHISSVNYAEMTGDRLGQPADDLFSIGCTFLTI